MRLPYLIIILIGTAAGLLLDRHDAGIVLGALLGLLVAGLLSLRQRISSLEESLAQLTARQFAAQAAAAPTSPVAPPQAAAPRQSRPADDTRQPAVPAQDELLDWEIELDTPASPSAPSTPAADQPESPTPTSRWWVELRERFAGVNLVVRTGIVILLFGIGFLVKYAAAHDWVPIELRLGAAFVAGMGLLALGWRLRQRRAGYALALQGGGIGCMYLTLFAAARLYQAVPITLAFAVMLALVIGAGILAVLQDGCSLALLAAGGGFMAPLLLSTGGSHVTLFAYYGLLNLGILGIAWIKPWRALNLTGFLFTFGIGASWGYQYYRPEHFASTEPFLILFFLIFVALAVLFALRQPPRLAGMVDGALVFGLPLVVFGLQYALVRRFEYGLALSAVTLGLFYVALATILWRHRNAGLRLLTEAFLAMGIVFGSVAIPLALEGRWTAAAWSLEGAALVWVGLRQQRMLSRLFGLLLQLGAGVAFLLADMGGTAIATGRLMLLNGHFLGALLICLAAGWSSYWLQREANQLKPGERWLDRICLGWSLLWWLMAGLGEVDRFVPAQHHLAATLVVVLAGAAGLGFMARRLAWPAAGLPPLALWPTMLLLALAMRLENPAAHPFDAWGAPAWLAAMAAHYWLLRRFEARWPLEALRVWHPGGLLLALALLSWESAWSIGKAAQGSATWPFVAWALVPSTALLALAGWSRERVKWPFSRWPEAYFGWTPAILAALLGLWSLAALAQTGNPAPLSYLPLLNPLDLAQLFALLAVGLWLTGKGSRSLPPLDRLPGQVVPVPLLATAFLWLNAVIARSVHHWQEIAYRPDALLRSTSLQAALALFWTLCALAAMLQAHRRAKRIVWFAGAGLLGLVVLKLFTLDLSGSGTIARIVSFLAVGGLMLVIGFFAPLPPAEAAADKEKPS